MGIDVRPDPVITPVLSPSLNQLASEHGFVTATLLSLDTGQELLFLIQPSEFDYEGDTEWERSQVLFGSPEPIEYKGTEPTQFGITAYFDAYSTDGESGSIADVIAMLEHLRRRVPGKNRAHVLMYIQGQTQFTGVLKRFRVKVRRLNTSGGPLQAPGAEILLEEIDWNGL
ncbi:MAG: hypothetical protein ACREDR_41165 [Blastocatellia bacterium]